MGARIYRGISLKETGILGTPAFLVCEIKEGTNKPFPMIEVPLRSRPSPPRDVRSTVIGVNPLER
jgi:hypothetical protein